MTSGLLSVIAYGYSDGNGLVGLGVLALAGGSWLYGKLTSGEQDPVEQAKEKYANDEITHAEFERRVELAVDGEADRIRNTVEPINGVGGKTSAEIAHHFDSVEELRNADRAELESVHGVGEKTAEAIKQRVSR